MSYERAALKAHTTTTLTVSICHVPQHTTDAMYSGGDGLDNLLAYQGLEDGWMLHTSAGQILAAESMGHPELAKLLKLTEDAGFAHLILAEEGLPLPPVFAPEFPHFER